MRKTNNDEAKVQASPDFVFTPPAIELLYPGQDNYFWPEVLRNDLELNLQIEKCHNLWKGLDKLFSSAEIDESFAEIYNQLANFIEFEDFNVRLILYLPFEIIPDVPRIEQNSELGKALIRFRQVYLDNWFKLLFDHDIRANFVDGDIFELGTNYNQTLVNKAAHLAPILVLKRLIKVGQIIDLIEETSDSILKNSLFDAITALSSWGLVSSADFTKISQSSDSLLRNLAVIIKNSEGIISGLEEKTPISTRRELRRLLLTAEKDLIRTSRSINRAVVNEARFAWERERDIQNILEVYSERIARSFLCGSLSLGDLRMPTLHSGEKYPTLLGILSFNKIFNKIATTDLKQAQSIHAKLKPQLLQLWEENLGDTKKYLEKMWLHCEHLKIVDAVFLKKIGLAIPSLDKLFTTPINALNSEKENLRAALEKIIHDPKISRFLYPLLIIYGSKVKGYGLRSADVDLAVFVKPGINLSCRPQIKNLLKDLFASEKLINSVLEFWITENNSQVAISDFPIHDKSLGNSAYAHVLFNGIWFGPKELISKFYREIMINYLYSQDDSAESLKRRSIWLKEIERDLLQYRLMHKGYSQIRPEAFYFDFKNIKDLDVASSFWDSGYRRVATKLFVTKVFLPQIKNIKKPGI